MYQHTLRWNVTKDKLSLERHFGVAYRVKNPKQFDYSKYSRPGLLLWVLICLFFDFKFQTTS